MCQKKRIGVNKHLMLYLKFPLLSPQVKSFSQEAERVKEL